MRAVKEMLLTELRAEHQALKSLLFVSRYGSRFKLIDGELRIVRIEQTAEEKALELRDKEIVEEVIRRRNLERGRWRPTEQE